MLADRWAGARFQFDGLPHARARRGCGRARQRGGARPRALSTVLCRRGRLRMSARCARASCASRGQRAADRFSRRAAVGGAHQSAVLRRCRTGSRHRFDRAGSVIAARRLYARDALLPGGWTRDVAIEVDDRGTIVDVKSSADVDRADTLAGTVVPAMPNVHSHAFQRALAGRTGMAPAREDSFWTWREAMSAVVRDVDADVVGAIAAQAYLEMAKAGYASVAEFHYVHHDPRGNAYADPAELAWRVVAAAQEVGLGLTLLPVFYAHGGFGGVAPCDDQRRFLNSIDGYARLLSALIDASSERRYIVGVAPHSLRA